MTTSAPVQAPPAPAPTPRPWWRRTPTVAFGWRRAFPWANLVVDTRTYRSPEEASEIVSSDSRTGRGYRVLCSGESPDGTGWYRTYLGWLKADEAEIDPATGTATACYGRYS